MNSTAWATSTVAAEFDVQLGKRLDAAVNRGELRWCINNRGVRWGRILVNDAIQAPLTSSDIRELRLRDGDVLVCEGGEIGRSAVWHGELREAYFLNTLHRLRSKGRYHPSLLVAYLERWASTGELSALVGKATLAHLTKENLLRVPLPVLPEAEQQRVVGALNDINELIPSVSRLIAKKRGIKQGMMQQLLTGRARLPGFSEPWEASRLGSALKVRNGRSQRGVQVPSGRYPILATGGEIGRTDTAIYDKPSVLIGRKGTIDRPQFMDTPFWTVDTLFYTEVGPHADARYLYYLCTTIDWMSLNEATGVPSLTGARIESVEVILPGREEQEAIAAVIRDADAEIAALERRLEATRAIKQGMMQELLTGRTRLPTKEDAA